MSTFDAFSRSNDNYLLEAKTIWPACLKEILLVLSLLVCWASRLVLRVRAVIRAGN